MAYFHRFLLPGLLLAAGLLAVSCTPGGEEAHPNLVSIEPASQPRPAAAADQVTLVASTPAQSLAPFTEDDVFDVVNDFVDARDAIVVGDQPLTTLQGTTTDAVQAQVAAERDENLANIENHSVHARVSYTTFTYVLDSHRVGDQVAAVTCLERWGQRAGGVQQVVFVDQAMIFDVVDDQLRLAEVRTAHDGERATDGLTCFVGVMGERAINAAQAGVEALEAINADPALAAKTDFASLFSGVALDSFAPIADNVDLSRQRVSPVEVRYTPLGIDPSKGIDFIGAVSVCRHYPEGVYDEVIATGERIQVNGSYGPGTSVEDIVYVHIEPKRRSQGGVDHFWDFTAEVSQGCWS